MEKGMFQRSHINFDKLVKFGFIKKNENYYYARNILDNQFRVEVIIDSLGKISSKVIDLETNEEYVNVKMENQNGMFVNKVREEYYCVLTSIKDKCFEKDLFLFAQSNRIAKYIYEKYHDKPQFLWKKYIGYGVFRNKKNNKWYAIIMDINKNKLDNEDKMVEIMNVKQNVNKMSILVNEKGYYKAYHMNKKDWVSILLDDTLSDSEIISCIDESWNIINNK